MIIQLGDTFLPGLREVTADMTCTKEGPMVRISGFFRHGALRYHAAVIWSLDPSTHQWTPVKYWRWADVIGEESLRKLGTAFQEALEIKAQKWITDNTALLNKEVDRIRKSAMRGLNKRIQNLQRNIATLEGDLELWEGI